MGVLGQPVWVFGYGSLIWKVDFPYVASRSGAIVGWERRFWQGSHDHRGVPTSPGRVVTLIESPGAVCAGMAYLVEPTVFDHLDHREKNGYVRVRTCIQCTTDETLQPAVVYVADPHNHAFLGDAPLVAIAHQIATSRGPSGANAEYLFELAAALRNLEIVDAHVFELEAAVRDLT